MNQQIIECLSDRPVWSQEGPWCHDATGFLDGAWEGHVQSLRHACPLRPGLSDEHAYWQSGLNIQGAPVGRFSYHPESHRLHQNLRLFPCSETLCLLLPKLYLWTFPVLSALLLFFSVIYWPNHETRVPWPGIKPVLPQWQWGVSHWSTREGPLPFLTPR